MLTPSCHVSHSDQVSCNPLEKKFMMTEPAEKKARMPVKLGYWKIRGLGQPIRLLLKYTGTEFENIMYGGEGGYEQWVADRETLGLDLPNLPYYIDGDIKLTQSLAILGYIGEKNNLCGKTLAERAVVHMLECEAMDFRNGFIKLCYNKDFDNLREGYVTNVRKKIAKYSEYLGTKEWFAGEITYVDFFFYELLDQHRTFQADLIENHPNLKAYLDRFEALPAIKEYMSSSEYFARPINGASASWK